MLPLWVRADLHRLQYDHSMITPLLATLLALSPPPPPDIDQRPPYEEAVRWAADAGIMTGDPDGQLHLDRGINRSEVVTVLSRFKKDMPVSESCAGRWSDVPANAWYASSLCALAQRGAAKGYPDGTFRGANNVVFTEAAKWIISEASTLPPSPSIPWYEGPIQDLMDAHAIPESITRIDKPLTRGEFIEILWRIATDTTDQPSKGSRFPIPSDEGLPSGSASFEVRADGVYYGTELLKGADKATFGTMDGDDFARDLTHCFYRWVHIVGCTSSGLRNLQLGSLYATDGVHVFYGNLYVDGVDAAKARVVGHLLTDGRSVYRHTEKLEGIDAATLESVTDSNISYYARDAKQVYFLGGLFSGSQVRVVTGANPATFTVSGWYGIDGTQRYCGARPATDGDECSINL